MPIDEVVKLKLKNQEDKFHLMFEHNTQEHLGLKESMNENFAEIKELIQEIKDNKANKWVEVLLVWLGGAMAIGLITWLGSLVYKATITFK